MGGLVEDAVLVQRHDLYAVLYATDEEIRHLSDVEVQALERLSNVIGYVPHMEGPWHERIEDTGAA